MKLTEIDSTSFNKEALQSDKIACVKFTAEWCGPCRSWEPVLETVAEETQDKCSWFRLDIDESSDVASKYGVKSIPTLIFFKGGELQSRLTGRAPKDNILALINAIE